jgi:hypothetical protein
MASTAKKGSQIVGKIGVFAFDMRVFSKGEN